MRRFLQVWLASALIVAVALILLNQPSNSQGCIAPTQSVVQAAINSASSGATILVCAGTATWNTSLTSSTPKALNIIGAGIGNTVITDTSTGDVFNFKVSASHFVRVSGFTFTTSLSKGSGWDMDGENSSAWFQMGFRVDHNRFITSGTIAHYGNPTGTFGLIDNNIFDVQGSGSNQSISPTGTPDGSDGGFTAWQQVGLNMGGNNAVFIEDNTFNYSSAAAAGDDSIDAYGGARVVIRHNTFNNAHVGFHGYDSGNRRSPAWIEIYQNTFVNNSATTYRLCTFRGGTGVVWGNSTGGTHASWDGCTLMVYRASPGTGDPGGWQNCNGNKYVLGSSDFNNGASRSAIADIGSFNSSHVGSCSTKQENVCTSNADCSAISGGTCQPWSDGNGNAGYPCRDQPGTGQNQVRDPIYFWGNSGPGNRIEIYDGGSTANGGGLTNYLLAGRDYVDNGTTAKPGYTPFTYPHPFQGAGTPQVSTPTFNPTAGTYSTTQSVTLSTTTSGAVICYTLDGTTPTTTGAGACTAPTLAYSSAITIPVTTTIKAIGTKSGNTDSAIATALFSIVPATPRTLYVSGAAGCSDTAGQIGDVTHPFCTFDYGITRIAGGDTLIVRAGTYTGNFTITGPSGSASGYTNIRCQTGEACKLTNNSIAGGRVKLDSVSYVTFGDANCNSSSSTSTGGFEITNFNQGLFIDNSSNIKACGNNIHGIGQEGMHIHRADTGVTPGPSSFITACWNIINQTGQTTSLDGEGIYIGTSTTGGSDDDTNNVTACHNTISQTSSEGIEVKPGTHDITVSDNNVSASTTVNNGFGGAAIEISEAQGGTQVQTTNPNHIVTGNTVHDVGVAGFPANMQVGIRVGTGTKVFNNVLYNILGVAINADNANSDAYPRLIYHNTVDEPAATAIVNAGGNPDVQNNIGPSSAGNLAINSSYFVNYASHDYHLIIGAAPISAGANLNSITPFDKDGTVRLTPPDIGAYQHTIIINRVVGHTIGGGRVVH